MRGARLALIFLLIFIGVVALAAATPVRQDTLPTLPPSPTPVCAGAARTRLIVYERGRVTLDDPSPLNMRAGPRTTFDVLGRIPNGEVFFVLEGPRCSERYAWFRVGYGDLTGWIAEGSGSAYFAEPYLPG